MLTPNCAAGTQMVYQRAGLARGNDLNLGCLRCWERRAFGTEISYLFPDADKSKNQPTRCDKKSDVHRAALSDQSLSVLLGAKCSLIFCEKFVNQGVLGGIIQTPKYHVARELSIKIAND